MPRTPKSTDGDTSKMPTGKAKSKPEAETKILKTKTPAAKSAKPKAAKPGIVATPVVEATHPAAPAPSVKEVLTMVSLEERIRIRAYELYLRRGGRGGTPEQDWFEAAAELYGESVA
jgi:hypothetical protein